MAAAGEPDPVRDRFGVEVGRAQQFCGALDPHGPDPVHRWTPHDLGEALCEGRPAHVRDPSERLHAVRRGRVVEDVGNSIGDPRVGDRVEPDRVAVPLVVDPPQQVDEAGAHQRAEHRGTAERPAAALLEDVTEQVADRGGVGERYDQGASEQAEQRDSPCVVDLDTATRDQQATVAVGPGHVLNHPVRPGRARSGLAQRCRRDLQGVAGAVGHDRQVEAGQVDRLAATQAQLAGAGQTPHWWSPTRRTTSSAPTG